MDGPFVVFVGIGNMGWPMAARIARAGFGLGVADASSERVERFATEFHATCGPLRELAARCDVLVTMLPTSNIVEQVLFGQSGASDKLRPSTLVVEMSSGVPSKTQAMAQRLAATDIHLVDAPVSGGVKRAETGELAIMVGGKAADVERARPLLSCMGTSILPTGDVGSAHAMKALNNILSATGLAAALEVVEVGRRFGLDPQTMLDVLNGASGQNNATSTKVAQYVLSETYDAGFGLRLMLKDIKIAISLARELDAETPIGDACLELWARAAEELPPDADHTQVGSIFRTDD